MMVTNIKYDLTRANIKYSQSIKSNNKDHCHHICSGLNQPALLDQTPNYCFQRKSITSWDADTHKKIPFPDEKCC